jgi:hypothetical protein
LVEGATGAEKQNINKKQKNEKEQTNKTIRIKDKQKQISKIE